MEKFFILLFVITVSVLPACGGGDVQNPAATDASQSGFQPKLPIPRAGAEITSASTSSALASQAVNLQDAIAILKMIVGLEVNSSGQPVTAYQSYAADMDGNGKVELADAIAVLKRIVGLETPSANWLFFNQADSALVLSDRLNPGLASDLKAYVTSATRSNVSLVAVLRGDVVGSQFSYDWALTSKPAGSAATLASPTTVKPTFVADVVGSYVLSVIVNDGTTASSAAAVTVTVTSPTVLTPTPSVTLTSSSSSIFQGDSVTLTWSSTSTTSCTASGGWSGSLAAVGTQSVQISSIGTTAFNITCISGALTANASSNVATTEKPYFVEVPNALIVQMPAGTTLAFNAFAIDINHDGHDDLVIHFWGGFGGQAVGNTPSPNALRIYT